MGMAIRLDTGEINLMIFGRKVKGAPFLMHPLIKRYSKTKNSNCVVAEIHHFCL